MTIYRFADEHIDCPLDLSLARSPHHSKADSTITVRLNDTLESPQFVDLLHRGDLDGAPWALGALDGGRGWGAVLGTGCVARISADARHLDVTALTTAPDDWLAEAIVGWLLVYRLAVLGRPSFHASAATLDGKRAVGLVGPTHSGKSTMAAAALALGGSLIADDVLVPCVVGDEVVVSSTATAVKLRGVAQGLSDQVNGAMTFDDRLRMTDDRPSASLALSHIVFLDPDTDGAIRPLSPDQVVVRLIAESKVGTWLSHEARNREFDVACDVASRVPGFVIGRSNAPPSRTTLIDTSAQIFAPT